MKYGKKLWIVMGVAVLTVGAFFTGHSAGAASKTPGSMGDPLITRGYLEERLAAVGGGMEKVQLSRGEILTGEIGTEIVVLGGSLTAEGTGLVDLSTGTLTEEDTSLFLYHNYVAAEEGAGCEALSSCVLLVFGKYETKD